MVRCALGENNACSRVRRPVTSRPTLSQAKSSARNHESRLRQCSARHSSEGTAQQKTVNARDLNASGVALRIPRLPGRRQCSRAPQMHAEAAQGLEENIVAPPPFL